MSLSFPEMTDYNTKSILKQCLRDNTLYPHQKSLATLDGEMVDPEITIKLEMRDVLKVHDEQTNIYTIWYVEYDSTFGKIGMRKYPSKCFQWYCLPEGHINWNKGQISIKLICP